MAEEGVVVMELLLVGVGQQPVSLHLPNFSPVLKLNRKCNNIEHNFALCTTVYQSTAPPNINPRIMRHK